MISQRGFGITKFATDLAGISESPWEMLGLDMAPHIGYGSIPENPTKRTNTDRSISRHKHVKIFRGLEIKTFTS